MSRSGKKRGCEEGLGRGIWILGDFLAVEFYSQCIIQNYQGPELYLAPRKTLVKRYISVSAPPLGKQGLVMAT